MKHLIHKVSSHPLISGSIVVILGSTFASIFHFLFNLFMSRNLSVSDYGALASLLSLTTIFGLVGGAFVPTIVTFAGTFFAKKQYDEVRGVFYKVGFLAFIIGSLIFFSFIVFSEQIGNFFHIQHPALIPLVGFISLISYMSLINTALLQSRMSFGFLSFFNILSGVLRLFLGVGFVLSGFSIVGAMWANALSGLIPYLVTFIPLKFLLSVRIKTPPMEIGKLLTYGAPAAFSLFALTSLVTVDIILIKHFFNPTEAGIYAGVSLIGRIVFFLTAPIGVVMFPLVVQKHARQENYHKDFVLSLLLVIIPALLVTLVYWLIPDILLTLATKAEYAQGSHLLGVFGIFSTLYAILYLFTNFFLSIRETKIFIPLIIGAAAQALGIWFYHESFLQIILLSIGVVGLLLIILLLYYLKIRPYEQ